MVMKRSLAVIVVLVIALLVACGGAETQSTETTGGSQNGGAVLDSSAASSALSDWILGTSLGITSGNIDESARIVTLEISADRYSLLTDQDKVDIETAVYDILSVSLTPSSAAREYGILYSVDGQMLSGPGLPAGSATTTDPVAGVDGSVVNLVFIHHSVGENWLNDGLCQALNDSGYHVADIYYGWREYGDNTDTVSWPTWFTDEVMDLVYQEMNTMTAQNALEAAAGENTVIMFKSCFPNSEVGSDASDEMAIYDSLLPYFEQHPDKMFVLVTPPPMLEISDPQTTRSLCDWLTDRQSGWLSGLSTGNVFVFDLYNVLTDPEAHHHLANGEEVHGSVAGHDTLHYDSDGDNHPNTEGNVKATEEFIGLLNKWYEDFLASRG
jgi:hypothetical protein